MIRKIQNRNLLAFQFVNSITIFSLLAILFISQETLGQDIRLNRASVQRLKKAGEEVDQVQNPLKIGVSVGYNVGIQKLYNTAINPSDNTVHFDRIFPATVVLSTAVMFSLKTYYLRKKKDPNNKSTLISNTEGPVLAIPSRWSLGAVVNIARFSAQSNLYNQQIDGGLGIGYALDENIFLLGSLEFISVQQPRKYILDQYLDKNKQLLVDGVALKTFNYDDANIFTAKYIPSVSVKLVFGLALTRTGNNADAQAAVNRSIKQPDEEDETK